MNKIILAISIFLTACGCQGVIQNWQKDRLLNHLNRIKNYHGTFSETGVLDSKEPLVSEVWFEAPGKYSISVKSPPKYAGTQLSYDGSTMQIYYPQTKFAIIYKNVQPLTAEDGQKLIEDLFHTNVDSFHYTMGPKSKLAGHPVIQMEFRAKSDHLFIANGESKIYDEYSMPLATELHYRDGNDYGYSFSEIKFNAESITLPKPAIPADTIVSEWDMNSKGLTEENLKAQAGIKVRLPKNLPNGLKLNKIIKQAGPVPAFTALYEKKPYSLSVIFFKDYGISGIPSGRGLKVNTGKIKGRLLPNPHVSSYSFIDRGIQYVLIGNIPVEGIVEVAKEIGSQP
ncbi:MAG: outer membrane lipoprotein carrier protein LolA [Bdellovibrionota bacterium]